jgi:NNP family nitrate/nitrite transporter-like MFS transporter
MAPASQPGPSVPPKAWSVPIARTLAFTTCFMGWTMFGVICSPLKKTLGLNATDFGRLAAPPVLTGSLIRVPLGIRTDKYGGRFVIGQPDGVVPCAIGGVQSDKTAGTTSPGRCCWRVGSACSC